MYGNDEIKKFSKRPNLESSQSLPGLKGFSINFFYFIYLKKLISFFYLNKDLNQPQPENDEMLTDMSYKSISDKNHCMNFYKVLIILAIKTKIVARNFMGNSIASPKHKNGINMVYNGDSKIQK